jgi:Zn-dependent peptidase ImmA (M78 family)/transcriptional regulator with XRE-family HTH domain
MNSTIMEVAKRLKNARESLGLSVPEAARRAGFPSYQTLAKIEKGEREVRASELSKFSRIYYLDISQILLPDAGLVRDVPLLWRSAPDTSVRKDIEGSIRYKFEQYHLLETFLEIDKPQSIAISVSIENIKDEASIDKLATDVRKVLDLGSRPAFILQEMIEEKWSVKILYEELGFGSAASTVHPEYGAAIVVNSKEMPWRQRFTLGHELFHILTWNVLPEHGAGDCDEPSPQVERKADRFASTLLMPEAEVRQEVAAARSTSDLVDIARGFGVSTPALIYRMSNLNIIKRTKAEQLVTDPSIVKLDRFFRKTAAEETKVSERYTSLAASCLRKGHISKGKFCSLFDIQRSEVENFLVSGGLADLEGELLEDMHC